MVYVQRPDIPQEIANALLRENEKEQIKGWIEKWTKAPKNQRAPIPSIGNRHQEVSALMSELRRVFKGKCAYCEVTLEENEQRLDFFRPPYGALQEEEVNSSNPDHYFWLVWEWFNLYLACRHCRDKKVFPFPTAKQQRASLGITDPNELDQEEPLLLDPCRDNPLDFLEFEENGFVKAKGKNKARCTTTITILDLNRDPLRLAREKETQKLRGLLQTGLDLTAQNQGVIDSQTESIVQELKELCKLEQPFVGMKWQLLKRWLGKEKRPEVKSVLKRSPWKDLINQLNEIPHPPAKNSRQPIINTSGGSNAIAPNTRDETFNEPSVVMPSTSNPNKPSKKISSGKPTLTAEKCTEIERLVGESELEAAINLLLQLKIKHHEVIQIQRQFSDARKAKRKGTLSSSEFDAKHAQVADNILALISEEFKEVQLVNE